MADSLKPQLAFEGFQPAVKPAEEPNRFQAQSHTFTAADYTAAARSMGLTNVEDSIHRIPYKWYEQAAEKPVKTAPELAQEWKQAYAFYQFGDRDAFNLFNKDLTATLEAGSLFGPETMIAKINSLLPEGQGIILHNTTHGYDDFQRWTFQNVIQLSPDQASRGNLNDPEYGPCIALSSVHEVSTSPAWMKELMRRQTVVVPWRELIPNY